MEKTLWEIYNDTQLAELETLTADYKDFLDAGKTERECVTEVIRLAEKEGYVDLNQKDTLQAGDKVAVSKLRFLSDGMPVDIISQKEKRAVTAQK